METVTFILWVPDQQTQLWFFCGFEVNLWEMGEYGKEQRSKNMGKKYHESLEHSQGPKWLLLCRNNINKYPMIVGLSVTALHTKIWSPARGKQSCSSTIKKGWAYDQQGLEERKSCNSEWSLGLPLPEGCWRGHLR